VNGADARAQIFTTAADGASSLCAISCKDLAPERREKLSRTAMCFTTEKSMVAEASEE